jgi:hypothetical protein
MQQTAQRSRREKYEVTTLLKGQTSLMPVAKPVVKCHQLD